MTCTLPYRADLRGARAHLPQGVGYRAGVSHVGKDVEDGATRGNV